LLGQLSYAVRVAAQPIGAIVNVGAYVLFPAFARISPDGPRFERGLLRALKWMCRISFPLSLLLVPLGTPAVVLVFGARWRPAGHAVMALGFFCAALALDSIASEVWKAAGKPKLLPRMHAISLVATAVCVAALVPFGLVPAAVGMALGEIAAGAYAVRGISRATGIAIRRLLQAIWPPAAAAAAMAAVLLVSEHGLVHSDRYPVAAGIMLLFAQTVLGVALYVACLALLESAAGFFQSGEALSQRIAPAILSRNRQSASIR
jgi:PST family polysaccharide transporter